MSLILVKVARKDAAHYQDGEVYRMGVPFKMEESVFDEAVPGFFERADASQPPMEQIKSKELPKGEPAKGPIVAAVQEPEDAVKESLPVEQKETVKAAITEDAESVPKERKKLELKKQR
jgi:hypothetical protein